MRAQYKAEIDQVICSLIVENNNMSDFRGEFHRLLMGIELPSTMPFEEQKAMMSNIVSLINDNMPDKMFRYRSFNCRNYKAFCKNEVFAQSPSYYNDPYDSFVCYGRDVIIEAMEHGASMDGVWAIKQHLDKGGELPIDLQEILGQKGSQEYKRRLKNSSRTQLKKVLSHIKSSIPPYLKNADDIMQSATMKIQDNAAILCFSETVQSILMWSHYADSHKGYALEYDNRNMQTKCERCDKYINDECSNWIVGYIYPIKGMATKPYTMIYEELLLKGHSNEFELKEQIASALGKPVKNKFFNRLKSLDLDNYLTTNYDLNFEHTFDSYLNSKQETIYSIRTYVECSDEHRIKRPKIWHIHGDVERLKSISLGLNHYCGTVGKMDDFFKGNYEFQENNIKIRLESLASKLLNKNDWDGRSWIELFFTTNIHIIGFSFDYSEIDLWWLLNRRARPQNFHTKDITNSITYYDIVKDQNATNGKKELLEAIGVIYRPYVLIGENWQDAYDEIFFDMENDIKGHKLIYKIKK